MSLRDNPYNYIASIWIFQGSENGQRMKVTFNAAVHFSMPVSLFEENVKMIHQIYDHEFADIWIINDYIFTITQDALVTGLMTQGSPC